MIALKVETLTMTETQVQLKESTVEFINELVAESYCQDDIYDFINEHSEEDFVNYYEEYVGFGEEYCYEAVDAFIAAFGIECVSHFSDAYRGQYDSEAEFAEEFVTDVEGNIPSYIVVDWEATWNYNLKYDFVYEVCGSKGFVFDRNF
jgi:hypothetical protein